MVLAGEDGTTKEEGWGIEDKKGKVEVVAAAIKTKFEVKGGKV